MLAATVSFAGATALALSGQPADLRAGLISLVETERAFAKASAERGIRDAFLAFLAVNSIVFRPGPVDGLKAFRDSPASAGSLSWYPVFADIASSGDLGYTTGPYESRSGPTEKPQLRHGHYVTLWRRQPDGAWKAVLDVGSSNPAPDRRWPAWTPPAPDWRPAAGIVAHPDMESERAELLRLEQAFSDSSQSRGVLRAYQAYLDEEARLLRPDSQPVTGRSRILAALPEPQNRWLWKPEEASLSETADLGYTYGISASRRGDGTVREYYYVRIWRRRGGAPWKLVLDIANPMPQSAR